MKTPIRLLAGLAAGCFGAAAEDGSRLLHLSLEMANPSLAHSPPPP